MRKLYWLLVNVFVLTGCVDATDRIVEIDGPALVSSPARVNTDFRRGVLSGLEPASPKIEVQRHGNAEEMDEPPNRIAETDRDLPPHTEAVRRFMAAAEPSNPIRCERSHAEVVGSGRPQLVERSAYDFNRVSISGPMFVFAEFGATP